MLPHVYSDPVVMEQVLDDYEQADIPLQHKLCWSGTQRFVRRSWEAVRHRAGCRAGRLGGSYRLG